ncbi:hypothetical protein ACFE04_015583 [Oxalis oulophora]
MPPPNLLLLRRLSATTVAANASSAEAGSSNKPIKISKLRSKFDRNHKALKIHSSISKLNALDATVRRLAESKRFDDVVSLIESHKQNSEEEEVKTESFLSSLINCYGVASMPDHALGMYNKIDELGFPRTVLSFNAVLNAFVRSKCCQKVPTLFKEISDKYGIIPNEDSFKILVMSYCESGLPEKGVEVLEQMHELGIPPTIISFNVVLTGFVQSKCYEKVPTLFQELSEKYGIVPDTFSYAILVSSYCELGLPEKGLEVLELMKAKNMQVTGHAYNMILIALYNKGNIDEVEKLWTEMLKNGCGLSVVSYTARIRNVGDDVGKAKGLIEEMREFGLKPDILTYNVLMDCFCRNGNSEEVKKVYEGLQANGCTPDAVSFGILINHLCVNAEYEDAYKMFKESVKVNKIPNFDKMKDLALGLVDGLMEKNKLNEAKEFLCTLKEKFPNFTNAQKKAETDGVGSV